LSGSERFPAQLHSQHREDPVATIEIPSAWTAKLNAYTEQLQAEAVVAAEKAVSFIHERVVAKANADPQWVSMADKIEVWSQDGQFVVGIQDSSLVSEAFALEYGDEVRPPSPLFRTLNEEIKGAGQVMGEHMTAAFGPQVSQVPK
jgi:hypothetical protein